MDSINKMVQSLQLNIDDSIDQSSPTSMGTNLVDRESPQVINGCHGANSDNETGSRKKRKLSRQKERKRTKKLENEDNMVDKSVFQSEISSFLPSSSTKLKTTIKPKKFLKKKLSEKSLISKEDYDYTASFTCIEISETNFLHGLIN